MRLQLELSGVPRKVLAEELGADDVRLCRWLNDNYPDRFPADLLPVWTREVGPGLLNWIARETGRELVATDAALGLIEGDPVHLVALISRHSGATVAQTLEDIASGGQWDGQERKKALHAFLRLQALINGLVDELQREVGK
jgi:hypothetical protein